MRTLVSHLLKQLRWWLCYNQQALRRYPTVLSGASWRDGVRQSVKCNRNLSAGLRRYTDPVPAWHRYAAIPVTCRHAKNDSFLQIESESGQPCFVAFPDCTDFQLDVISTVRQISWALSKQERIEPIVTEKAVWSLNIYESKEASVHFYSSSSGSCFLAVGGLKGDSTGATTHCSLKDDKKLEIIKKYTDWSHKIC